MKKGRFLWSAHRITKKQKAGKARNIKEKQLKNSRSTVSRPLVAHLNSASVNRLLRLYQNGSKTPENQGFPGLFNAKNRWYCLSWFERIWHNLTLFLVVNDGGTSVFDPILVNRWGNFSPKSGDAWRVFLLLFSVLKMLPLMWCWTNHKEWTVLAQSDQM